LARFLLHRGECQRAATVTTGRIAAARIDQSYLPGGANLHHGSLNKRKSAPKQHVISVHPFLQGSPFSKQQNPTLYNAFIWANNPSKKPLSGERI